MAAGRMSASTIQPARMAHPRQALLLVNVLATMMTSAMTSDIQARMAGGQEDAPDVPPSCSQCHGPPRVPGRNLRKTRFHANVPTAWSEAGAFGCAVDEGRAKKNTAKYPASKPK